MNACFKNTFIKKVPTMKLNICISVATLALVTTFTACTKDAATNNNNTTDSTSNELTLHADDQSRISVETDNVTNEATATIEGNGTFSGNVLNILPEICDAT